MNIRSTRIVKAIDYVLLTVLGLFCFKYISFYGRYFAETHIQFSFFDFPVFIGEFLLLGCGLFFVLRMMVSRSPLNYRHYLLFFYFCFVMAKALVGYVKWGPLAFRDAALFYYFAFAVISYFAYRAEYFNRFVILMCYGLLLSFYFMPRFNDFWFLGRLMLCLIMAYRFPNRWIGGMMALGILVCSPYQYFTETARTFILGNFISAAFLIFTLTLCLERRLRLKLLAAAVVLTMVGGVYVFGYSNCSAATIFKWSKIVAIYKSLEQDIKAGESDYHPEAIKQVRLYNPDPPPPVNSLSDLALESSKNPGSVSQEPQILRTDDSNDERQETEKESIESNKLGNAIFRIFIWRDVLVDLATARPVFGFDFGKPFRSKSLEIIRSAIGEWERDGWISMHNSYLNILYRSGIFGVIFLFLIARTFIRLTCYFVRIKSFVGLSLCAVILDWLIAANFTVVLELPYSAIPLWVLGGLTLGFAHHQMRQSAAQSTPKH